MTAGAEWARRPSLQPYIPHVLHDLPLVFRRAKKASPSHQLGTRRLAPIKSTLKLADVPDSHKVLWPKPKVECPHYPSASPELLSEFVSSLGQQLVS